MKTLLWLDDCRNPFDTRTDWLVFSPIGRDVEVVWAQTVDEFMDYIDQHGLPDGICFDHDLGEDSYDERTGTTAPSMSWTIVFSTTATFPRTPSNPIIR